MKKLITHYGLGQQAEHFVSDDPDQWLVTSGHEVKVVMRGRVIATIDFEMGGDSQLPLAATVVIGNIYNIIRGQHLREFDPALYGIEINNTYNWLEEKEPDIDATLPLDNIEAEIIGLELPRRVVPRRLGHRKFKVKPSLHGGGA